MNKKNIVFSVFVLLILFSAIILLPVKAAPTKAPMIPVVSVYSSIPEIRSEGATGKDMDNGVSTFKNFIEVYHTNMLFIDDNPIPLTVCVYMIEAGSFNPQTETLIINGKSIWYISEEGSSDGFAGQTHLELLNYNPNAFTWTDMSLHEVLQGFGAYEGQTLMFSYSGPASPFTEGYLLIR